MFDFIYVDIGLQVARLCSVLVYQFVTMDWLAWSTYRLGANSKYNSALFVDTSEEVDMRLVQP